MKNMFDVVYAVRSMYCSKPEFTEVSTDFITNLYPDYIFAASASGNRHIIHF